MACNGNLLKKLLSRLKNDNIKKEYYLTDIIDMAVTDGLPVNGFMASTWEESMGINDKIELAKAERLFQEKLAKELMQNGVTIMDPARIDIRGDIKCGGDVLIDVNTVFEGNVNLGNNVKIGPNTYICDATIGDNSVIHANSHILGAEIGTNAQIGPFARLRPGTELQNNVKVGNFVEIKKSSIGTASKVNHLSYIGDSEIGDHVNIGAGTITCNYDGANKHKTQIDDGAFIGSGVELVAPVKIGKDATIGAGSTISKDVEDKKLSVERADQKMINDWKRPKKS
jgi:bifunctional UDP-N-acetylglucosamine pyrophosphorylase/glucosamine-1-phosphate N-acetyltransferase